MSNKGWNQFLGGLLIVAVISFFVPFLEPYQWLVGVIIFIIGIHLLVREEN